ncbi:hypothetical protein FLW53_21845 [Microbispora sp. SCL1-1]|uniref:hypothetical protein n=1 Tax=unclassified Microbispora TaxID=2614687 RepID=UPI00115B2A96|nr:MULTISPECIES: hypothetical protein [unclassified Microbispora]NJP26785.1 hypothetical protein [Microbispora sp. CL1-1]TQS11979.1 hypothetical protein FLW53_21845 [Microbispora sp. SCL1-1]
MTNDDHRTALIVGLRALADFLDANPAVPVPLSVNVLHFPHRATDTEMCAEVDHIAELLGASINQEFGHYGASVYFGPVEYKAVAILSARRAQYEADRSYEGCIQPDPIPNKNAAQAA